MLSSMFDVVHNYCHRSTTTYIRNNSLENERSQDETVTNRFFVINNKPAVSQSCSFGLIFAHCANDLFIEQYGGTWLLFCLLAPVFRFPTVIFGQVGVCGVPLWGLFNRAARALGMQPRDVSINRTNDACVAGLLEKNA